jgi:hypothetical protein
MKFLHEESAGSCASARVFIGVRARVQSFRHGQSIEQTDMVAHLHLIAPVHLLLPYMRCRPPDQTGNDRAR